MFMFFLAQLATKYCVDGGYRGYKLATFSVVLRRSNVVAIQRPKLALIKLAYRGLCDSQNLLNTLIVPRRCVVRVFVDEVSFVSVLNHDEFADEFKVFSCFLCGMFSVRYALAPEIERCWLEWVCAHWRSVQDIGSLGTQSGNCTVSVLQLGEVITGACHWALRFDVHY